MNESPVNPPSPQGAAAPPLNQQNRSGGKLGGWTGLVALFVIFFWIADYAGCSWTQTQMSDSWKAGQSIGFISGSTDYNGGRRQAGDDELDAAARRITAGVRFDSAEKRDEWIRGYKAGYRDGWNAK